MKEILLEIKNMSKKFGSTVALNNVDLTLCKGEIRGLIGENGSGKSTITSITCGMQSADEGTMYYKGVEWNPKSMVDAQKNQISMILQEANTIPHCSVAENLIAGREEEFVKFGVFQKKKMLQEAQKMLDWFEITHIKPEDNIDMYGFEDKKLIEIVRAVSEKTEILVIDETTTALSFEGRQILYRLMNYIQENNKAVIFISHDLDEIMSKCSVLTILRDGNVVGEMNKEEIAEAGAEKRVRHLMVGREIGDAYYRDDYNPECSDEVVFQINNVTTDSISDFSLEVHKGEIIGIGGLSNCGMHDIGRIAFGLDRLKSGNVLYKNIEITSPKIAVKEGVGYISKNRDTDALLLNADIQTNIILPSLSNLTKGPFLMKSKIKSASAKEIDVLKIKCKSDKQWVSALSGGNKQKVSFSKWLLRESEVIVMDCPTRGVDIGVKQAMYQLIYEMKKSGKAIIMISEELPELIGMADKIVIMKNAKITQEFVRSEDLKETDIVEYMV